MGYRSATLIYYYYFRKKCLVRGIRMQEPIVVVDADEKQRQEMCTVLEREDYRTVALHSLATLDQEIQEGTRQIVILDLDTIPVDNRFFRGLRRQNPGVCIIGLSSRPFHPELKEAMSSHIYACLGKPVDEEELVYWIKSLCE
jgi:DNA-binding NtrC family response regulator